MAKKKQKTKQIKKNNIISSKKHKKKTLGFFVVALIFSLLAIFGLIRLNFILKEEIVITPESHIKTFTIKNKEIISPEIKVDIINRPGCTATCIETIQDLSTTQTIYNNSFKFSNKEKITPIFNYEVNEFGHGTKILSYKIECTNQKTSRCPASDDTYTGRMAILIEYSPTNEEQQLIELFRNTYKISSLNIKKSEAYNSEANTIINLLRKTHIFNAKNEFEYLKEQIITLERKTIDSKFLLEQKNYDVLKKFLEESGTLKESEQLLEQHETKFQTLKENIEMQKTISEIINLFLDDVNIINSAYLFIKKDESEDTNTINTEILTTDINTLLSSIENKYFESYEYIEQETNSIRIKVEELLNTTVEEYLKTSKTNIVNALAENLLCVSEGNSDCTHTSAQKIYDKSQISHDQKEKIISLTQKDCQESEEVLNKIFLIKESNTTTNKDEILERKKIIVSMLKKEKTKLRENNITEKYLYDFIDSLMKKISENYFNITEISENYYPDQYNQILVYKMNPDEESITKHLIKTKNICETNIINPYTYKISYDNITITQEFLENITPDIIPELKPECCIYGECAECGIKPLRNPVILLHGHSFSTSTTAFTSADIFGPFEEKLFTDNLFIPLGYVRSFSNIESYKNLAQLRIPITIRPTYYTESYIDSLQPVTEETKSASIDTYAIRLNNIIEKTKEATGSEQVTIIAHSMGGLVTRRYLQVFGENSVDKLIMIGTPNKGIDPEVERLCRLLGQRIECGEMAENSLFIKKINSDKMPEKTKMYLIIGYGCDGAESDWDGVILKRNAELEGVETFYYNGTCEGAKLLHNRMLRPNEYPEIYEKVKEILLE